MRLESNRMRCATAQRSPGTLRHWVDLLCAVPLLVGVAMIALASSRPAAREDTYAAATAGLPEGAQGDDAPERLVGRWRRPDGGYVLEIAGADRSGQLQVRYLNPQPIRVAKAQAHPERGALAVYVELQDAGYPGNYYKLSYEAGRDRLVGTYHQPAAGQQFSVCFERFR